MRYSREKCGHFASVQLRRDKKRSIVASLDDGKMVEEKKVSLKIQKSIKQTIEKTVRYLYIFVGISNFKFPLCILFIEVTEGAMCFSLEKNYAIPCAFLTLTAA